MRIKIGVIHLVKFQSIAPRAVGSWLAQQQAMGESVKDLSKLTGWKPREIVRALGNRRLPAVPGRDALVLTVNDIEGRSVKQFCMEIERLLFMVLLDITSDRDGSLMDRRVLARAVGAPNDSYLRRWEERIGFKRPTCRKKPA